jgi:hypothetical protein
VRDIGHIHDALDRPEFIVLPDIVGGGLASLEASRHWIPYVRGLAPLYLAVQDGMQAADLEPIWDKINGLFVGGTLRWKVRTGESWVQLARLHGKPCHIGRCGSVRRVRWAMRIGATSIDSALPLWSEENLDRFLRALEPAAQMELEAA